MAILKISSDCIGLSFINLAGILTGVLLLSGCALWDASTDSPEKKDDVADVADAVGMDIETDTLTKPDDVDVAADDATEDVGIPSGCQEIGSDTPFVIQSVIAASEYQPRATFDGAGVWVVYTSAQDTQFDIFATRILCDGSVVIRPFKINSMPLRSENQRPDPKVDIKGDTVYFSWSATQSGQSSDGIFYRTFSVSGTALMDEERAVEFQLESASSGVETHDLIGLSSEYAVIARAGVYETRRQIHVQKLNRLGEPQGAAIAMNADSTRWYERPSLTAESSDKIWLSAQRLPLLDSTDRRYYAVYQSVELNAPLADTEERALLVPSPLGRTLSFAKNIVDPDQIYFTVVVESDSQHTVRLGNAANHSNLTVIADSGSSNDRPSVAAAHGGGAVAWYHRSQESQLKRQIWVRAFHDDGATITLDEPRVIARHDINDTQALTGAPSIVHLGSDYYFVVWDDAGGLSNTRVKAAFIEL